MSGQQSVIILGVDDNNQPRPIRVTDNAINTVAGTAPVNVRFVDESGVEYGIKQIENKPRVSSMPYTYDIAEGSVENHTIFAQEAFTSNVSTSEFVVWGPGGEYVFPTAEMGMEVVSTDNTDDIGTAIHSGTLTGGSATTIVDTGADFTGGTAVAVGDWVILNKAATQPEFGQVTAVAANTLTCAGGFSRNSGGVAGKTYDILDYSATDGVQAIQICYLDDDFSSNCEIVIMNGTTAVATTKTDIYRASGFRVVAAGADNHAVGTVSLRHLTDTPIYKVIEAGFTFSRDGAYTVPAGYTIYITGITFSFGYAANQTHYCRLYLRANQFIQRNGYVFQTGDVFYPYAEVVVANNAQSLQLDTPLKMAAGTDFIVGGVSSTATGIASVVLRGWRESE